MEKSIFFFLLGADPLTDFPNKALAEAALQKVQTVVAVDLFVTPSVYESDVVLPAASFLEADGSHTNVEGRITPIRQKITPRDCKARLDDCCRVSLPAGI